jgi:NAD(P)-dependent dehydrogenase (short-subunit alcohol dehydrogenase family)
LLWSRSSHIIQKMTIARGGEGRAVFDLDGVSPDVIDAYHLDRLPLDRPRRGTTELLRLDGKVAVVTGGGGDGLGDAICHRLAEQGASIAVLDVDPAKGDATARELARLWGVDSAAITADVGDWDGVHDAVGQVVDRFGTIDVLVNNAGGSGSVGADGRRLGGSRPFMSQSQREIDLTVAVNYVGVMYTTRAVLEIMLAKHAGRIINIASEGGKTGMPGRAAYGSSKAAVIGFTRSLAHEVGPEGVSMVAVCPSIMVTDRLIKLGQFSPSHEGTIGFSFKRCTIGRASIPDEVASAVAFLASDAGAYLHGTAVSVGGGLSD